jgi:hypothetical protein
MKTIPLRQPMLAAFGLVSAVAAISPAQARTEVTPYIEVQQVLDADLGGGGDVVTYTSAAAGIDARVSSRRVDAQVSYRYERRIEWNDQLADEDVHSGLVAAHLEVAPEVLSINAGAIAARSRLDPRGSGFGFNTIDDPNIAQVYGIFAGPSLATHVGALAVNADYQIGYVKVDDNGVPAGNFVGGPLDRYDSAVSHDASASIGMAPGKLPFGWTLGGGYRREDTNNLDQTFEGKYVRGDVVVPVSSTLALTGGVGYEDLESTQQDFVRDVNGVPVTDANGELIADPTKPRLLGYDQSGIMWDAGVIWRPSPRTELTLRGGKRYGDVTVVGTLQYQISSAFAFSAVAYDAVTSFGQLVISDIDGLKPGFKTNRHGPNRGIGGLGGCVFGNDPGTGRCFDDALQSISTSNFRNRGVGLMLSGSRGPWDLQIGGGYARRKYLAADTGIYSLAGVTDQSVTVEASLGRHLTRSSGIEFDAYADWYDSGIIGNDPLFSTGATGTYYRSFLLDRLQAEASLGIYTTDDGTDTNAVGTALVGMSYTF